MCLQRSSFFSPLISTSSSTTTSSSPPVHTTQQCRFFGAVKHTYIFAKTVDKVPRRCSEAYFLPLSCLSFVSVWVAELSCDGVKVVLFFFYLSWCGIVDMSTLALAERSRSGGVGGRVCVREPRRSDLTAGGREAFCSAAGDSETVRVRPARNSPWPLCAMLGVRRATLAKRSTSTTTHPPLFFCTPPPTTPRPLTPIPTR